MITPGYKPQLLFRQTFLIERQGSTKIVSPIEGDQIGAALFADKNKNACG
jgi:hypothetical protein